MSRAIFLAIVGLALSCSAYAQAQYIGSDEKAVGIVLGSLIAPRAETFATPPVRIGLVLENADVGLGYWIVEGNAGCGGVGLDDSTACAPGISHLVSLTGSLMLGRQSEERPVSVQILANGAMRTRGGLDGRPTFSGGLGTRVSSRLEVNERLSWIPSFSVETGLSQTHFREPVGYVVGAAALALGITEGRNTVVLETGYAFALGEDEATGITFLLGVLRRF